MWSNIFWKNGKKIAPSLWPLWHITTLTWAELKNNFWVLTLEWGRVQLVLKHITHNDNDGYIYIWWEYDSVTFPPLFIMTYSHLVGIWRVGICWQIIMMTMMVMIVLDAGRRLMWAWTRPRCLVQRVHCTKMMQKYKTQIWYKKCIGMINQCNEKQKDTKYKYTKMWLCIVI